MQKQFYWGIYRKPFYHVDFFILPTIRSNGGEINEMVIIRRIMVLELLHARQIYDEPL